MKFEVVEYVIDKDGKEQILTTYEIDAKQLRETEDDLRKRYYAGQISSYEIEKV